MDCGEVVFGDFVYRNAKGKKKGDQLVDGIILFGDVMLLIEVKAQIGTARRDDWVRDRLGKAVSQLKKSSALLQQRQIPKLHNDVYGELDFAPEKYPNVFGIVVLAHDSDPYYAPDLVPELLSNAFPIHIFSLEDFELLSDRFDTAGDMITFLENPNRCVSAGKASRAGRSKESTAYYGAFENGLGTAFRWQQAGVVRESATHVRTEGDGQVGA